VKASPNAARVFLWADEIGDHSTPGLDYAIAHPPHSARMLDAIPVAESEIA